MELTLDQYKAHIKGKGYGIRVKYYSDFIALTYTHKGKALNIGKGIISTAELSEHSELQNSRMQYKGAVFDGMTRVIV